MPTGTSGNDALFGTLGNDTYDALAGNDVINGSDGTDTVNGGDGRDTLNLNVSNSVWYAAITGARSYLLTSTTFTDGLSINTSFTGIERINFSSFGSDFDVTIDASAFAPAAPTTTTFNQFLVGNGNDTIIGTAYDDSINAGLGQNVVNGGAGQDSVAQRIQDNGGTVIVTGSGATTTITQGVHFTTTMTNVEDILIGNTTTTANQTVNASASNRGIIFYDGAGNDVLIGSAFNDYFSNSGGAGNSVGIDTFTGGGGADTYDFIAAMQGFDGTTITDFDGDDVIDLNFNTAQFTPNLVVDIFIGTAAFSGTIGEYRYEKIGGQTIVQFDSNGDGTADGTLTIANGAFDLEQFENEYGIHTLRIDAGVITGTSGNDSLFGTLGNDTYDALAGNDVINGSDGTDTVYGGDGRDTLNLFVTDGINFTFPTGPVSYVLTASSFTNGGTINTSFTGIERINFSSALYNGNASFDASAWSPAPSATPVNSSFAFGSGNDTFIGSAFRDSITPGLGINTINGGAGGDSVTQRLQDNGGTVTIVTSGGVTTISQGVHLTTTMTNVEFINIGNSSLTVANQTVDASGAFLSVTFYDGAGNDVFIGGINNDLFANFGAPGLSVGNDTYTGGGGADIYDFTFAMQGFDGTTITDFDDDDYIDLNYNLPEFGAEFLVNAFIGTAAFSGTAGEYRYEKVGGQTLVQFDSNGDGVADGTLTIANGAFDLEEFDYGNGAYSLRIGAGAITGTPGSDTLFGTVGDDVIDALDGADTIFASAGVDSIAGGTGSDTLALTFMGSQSPGFSSVGGSRTITFGASTVTDTGGQINTSFTGIEGLSLQSSSTSFGRFSLISTTIDASAFTGVGGLQFLHYLGQEDINLTGTASNDFISIGQGSHQLNGGSGEDFLQIGFYGTLTASGSAANMTFTSGTYSSTATNFETVSLGTIGGAGAIDATGMTSDVSFRATYGMEILGGSGNDRFENHYSGGAPSGPSYFTGGAGADVYSYTGFGLNFDDDHITDFAVEDQIDLSPVGSFSTAIDFIGLSEFTGVVNQVRFQTGGGVTMVEVDTDGDGLVNDTLTIENGEFELYEAQPGIIRIVPLGPTLTGTVNADVLNGTEFSETISGLAGDDTLSGAGRNDTLNGGDGNDVLIGGEGVDVMTGGTGNDTYDVDDEGDQIIEAGGQGTDTVQTTVAVYTLGSTLENLAYTGADGFIGTGNSAVNRITGNTGDDVLSGLNGDDTLIGGAGNDTLLGGAGIDNLTGGAGDDVLDGGTSADIMAGGEGNDLYAVNLATDVVTELNNQGTDTINASIAWTLANNIENLTLLGGSAIDGKGNGAANIITGNAGINTLAGLGGDDTLIGGGGNDRLVGGAGADALFGGTGNDIYQLTDGLDTVTELAGQGTDLVQAYTDYTLGAHVENLNLFSSALSGTGNELANIIRGTTAANTLNGMAGDDSLYGGSGNDVIIGGAGRDQMFGEAGADRFVFADGDLGGTSSATADLIRDFSLTQGDVIDLAAVDAIVGGGDDAFALIGSAAFGGIAGELRYQSSATNTTVMGDTNGDGLADFWIVLTGVHALDATDFVL